MEKCGGFEFYCKSSVVRGAAQCEEDSDVQIHVTRLVLKSW